MFIIALDESFFHEREWNYLLDDTKQQELKDWKEKCYVQSQSYWKN